ncbi:sensor histidine kinase [Acuticoccus kandeliae]|uniref:sensor histidine kinase n=1 Tax=Acuticoccus kandeliae TaxID=2073160 RepID=UPI000D3E1799|nr:sensor histidine kinase [Acuticoccus kandeliae]
MTDAVASAHPVLIYAPLGADAASLTKVVEAAGFAAQACSDEPDLAAALIAQVPLLVIVAQEGATESTGVIIAGILDNEPSWSRLPVLFLVSDPRKKPPALARIEAGETASVFTIARPVRPDRLTSILLAQADARLRQFETRDLLHRLEEAEARQAFLLSELRHRTRNSLSVLHSLFSLSARRATDLETFIKTFSQRLGNLVKAHLSLSEEGDETRLLETLVREHVLPYCSRPEQLATDGPSVRLDHRTTFEIALIVHELATNAAKYGALSVEAGRVSVVWSREDETGDLLIRWQESGGPPVAAAPTRKGLGSTLIRTFAAGAVEVEFKPDGLVWRARVRPTHFEMEAAAAG